MLESEADLKVLTIMKDQSLNVLEDITTSVINSIALARPLLVLDLAAPPQRTSWLQSIRHRVRTLLFGPHQDVSQTTEMVTLELLNALLGNLECLQAREGNCLDQDRITPAAPSLLQPLQEIER